MSGIMNKLGLGHTNHTNDVAREAGHKHTSAVEHAADAGKTTTTTTTTTTNNNDLNRNINNSTLPSSTHQSSTMTGINSGINSSATGLNSGINSSSSSLHTADNMSARTGAAYTNTNTGLAAHNIHQSNNLSGDNAMTRSEEQLRVAKANVETGKAELNKTVETVHVEQAVPVQRERVVIEREPITQSNLPAAMSGPAISEAHYETTLKEDRVAATKETVPIERIRLAKQVETSVESVGADLRKEHIDLTMQNADQSKIDTTSSNYMVGRTGSSLASDKIDAHARSGLTNENVRNSHINTTTNTRNL